MAKVIIDKERCKGCGLCVKFCPLKHLAKGKKLNRKGVVTPEPQENVKCSGCGMCFRICPDMSIRIEKDK